MNWQVGLYATAVLLPLAAFAVEVIFIRQLKRLNAYLATGAIGLSFLLSLVGFIDYYYEAGQAVWAGHHAAAEPGEGAAAGGEHEAGAAQAGHETAHGPLVWQASLEWVLLGTPNPADSTADPLAARPLSFPIGVYIDNLSAHHVPDGHVHRHAHPHLFDRLHAR